MINSGYLELTCSLQCNRECMLFTSPISPFLTNFSVRPLLDVTPRNATIGRLLCDLFRDSVTEKVYDAELAGLQFSIDFGGDHITLGTVGYNDKLADLTETMLKLFMEFKIDPERFELIKDQVCCYGELLVRPKLTSHSIRSNEAG